jgi:hypothetical protein
MLGRPGAVEHAASVLGLDLILCHVRSVEDEDDCTDLWVGQRVEMHYGEGESGEGFCSFRTVRLVTRRSATSS